MNPQQTTSFIPKKSFSDRDREDTYKSQGMGFLVVVSGVIFLISAGVLGGAYAYKSILAGEVESLSQELENVKKEFDIPSIRDFSQTAALIGNAKVILGEHRAVSHIFEFLEDNTLPEVRFIQFKYGAGEEETTMAGQTEKAADSVFLRGEAASFTVLAEQALVFRESEFIKDLLLSNLSLGEGGVVKFNIRLSADENLSRYRGMEKP